MTDNTNRTSLSRPQALTDIALALALTVLSGLGAGWIARGLSGVIELPLLAVVVIQGVLILAGLQALLAHRGERWTTLRLGLPRARDFGLGVLTLLLAFGLNAAVSTLAQWVFPGLVEDHQQGLAGVAGILAAGLPLAGVAAAMLFVGFYEELLARGFLLVRCERLLQGIWAPVLLSSALFGLGHFYQGWLGVLQTALLGVLFARVTLHWQTLWPGIIAHALLNTVSLIVLRNLPGSA